MMSGAGIYLDLSVASVVLWLVPLDYGLFMYVRVCVCVCVCARARV
jgi:hypothetical protein